MAASAPWRQAVLSSMLMASVLLALGCSSSKPVSAPSAPAKPVPPVTSSAPPPSISKPAGPPVAVQAIPGAEKAEIRVGDQLWYSGGEGIARPTTIMREVVSVQGGSAQYRQYEVDGSGHLSAKFRLRRQSLTSLELDNPAKASGQVRYADFPMGLGKTWSYRYQLKTRNGSLTSYDIVARVESEENITTAAGTFKVLKIVHGGQWTVPVVNANVVKLSTGSLRSTVWFAPALGNWVRFESEILNSSGGLEAKVSQELVRVERR